MNDKKIKEAMSRYIEGQADKIISESQENQDLASLDEKVYATLNAKREKEKTTVIRSYKKITALTASFLLIIGLSITLGFLLNSPPEYITQDNANAIVITYENKQYGYYSNRIVIDKYDIKIVPDSIAGYLSQKDIIFVDSTINIENIIGAEIRPYNGDVIIIRGTNEDYYFEKIENE